jgi:aryl-alcohol dehydrogenase
MEITAAVLDEVDGAFEVQPLDLAPPGAREVLVRLVATGICHTDLKAAAGRMGVPLPAVLGHEGAGVVEAVGPGVDKVGVGDHVVLGVQVTCGRCARCLDGHPYWCGPGLERSFDGTMLGGGRRLSRAGEAVSHFFCQSSFASRAVVPDGSVIRVPPDVPLVALAPLGCGVSSGAGAVLSVARVAPGEAAAVLGCGSVGLSAVLAARAAGAEPLIAVDVEASRLRLATELGATHAVDASTDDPVAAVVELTAGGADHSFECIGQPTTVRQAVEMARLGGAAVITGTPGRGIAAEFEAALLIRRRILGNLAGSTRLDVLVPRLISLWRRGRFPFDRLTDRTYPLAAIEQAVAAMRRRELVKPVLTHEAP